MEPGLVTGIPYGPLILPGPFISPEPGVAPEPHWVWCGPKAKKGEKRESFINFEKKKKSSLHRDTERYSSWQKI